MYKQSCFFSLTTTHEFGLKSFSLAIENRGGVERLSFKNTIFFVRGHKVIAVTLLQHGADTTIKNSNGKKMNGSLLCVLHDRDLKQTTIAAARGRGKKKI